MRISVEIAKKLKSYLATRVIGEFKLYLFGSRTNDSAKGGDIDLLLELVDVQEVLRLKAEALLLKEHLRELAGDQKVDLVIATAADSLSDPFLKTLTNKIEL